MFWKWSKIIDAVIEIIRYLKLRFQIVYIAPCKSLWQEKPCENHPYNVGSVLRGTEQPPQYWCYPPTVLMLSLCSNDASLRSNDASPCSTEQPPQYWTDVIRGENVSQFVAQGEHMPNKWCSFAPAIFSWSNEGIFHENWYTWVVFTREGLVHK